MTCRIFAVHAWVLIMVLGGSVYSAAGVRNTPTRDTTEPSLTFEVHRQGGNSPHSARGLVLAGWSDGVVIFARNPEEPGKALQTGRIPPDAVLRLLEELRGAGFFNPATKEPGRVPDMSYTRMSVRGEADEVSHRWGERLSPAWGVHVRADPAFREFATMWAVSRTALAFAQPAEYQPLENDAEAAARLDRAMRARQIGRP